MTARRIPDPAERPTLTAEEVAALYGIGRSGVYPAADRGEIPSFRVGRHYIFPTAATLDRLSLGSPRCPDATEQFRVVAAFDQQIDAAVAEVEAAMSRFRQAVAAAKAVIHTQLSGGPVPAGPAATTTERGVDPRDDRPYPRPVA